VDLIRRQRKASKRSPSGTVFGALSELGTSAVGSSVLGGAATTDPAATVSSQSLRTGLAALSLELLQLARLAKAAMKHPDPTSPVAPGLVPRDAGAKFRSKCALSWKSRTRKHGASSNDSAPKSLMNWTHVLGAESWPSSDSLGSDVYAQALEAARLCKDSAAVEGIMHLAILDGEGPTSAQCSQLA